MKRTLFLSNIPKIHLYSAFCNFSKHLVDSNCTLLHYNTTIRLYTTPVNITDPSFSPEECGEACGNNLSETELSFCEKGEKCCPLGPFGHECSTECGPYDQNGTL